MKDFALFLQSYENLMQGANPCRYDKINKSATNPTNKQIALNRFVRFCSVGAQGVDLGHVGKCQFLNASGVGGAD